MNQSKITKVGLVQFLDHLIAGTKAHSSSTPIVFGGHSYTPQSLVDTLQSLADTVAKVDAAHAQWREALAQMDQVKAQVGPVAAGYQSFLLATYGSSPSALAAYGLTPRKPKATLTTEQRALATAKAKATRAARHTMGSKEKQGVKGNVAGVVVTPVTVAPVTVAPPGPPPKTA